MLSMTTREAKVTTLQEEIEAFKADAAKRFDAERSAVYAKAQEHIEGSGVAERALREGDKAPMFELPDAHGNIVNFADVLAAGPAIVCFYRGAWCPFCNLELRAYQRELSAMEDAGVTLVAISPNTPDSSLGLIDKHELTYPVLSDAENAVAKQFNLVYTMEEGLVEYYAGHDRDIAAMNGSEVWELPVPATYVVDRDGTIRYAFVDLNHRERAEPSEVVAIAAELV
jgi:peroxiredoxin